MEQLETVSKLMPVSFDDRFSGLTRGQRLLLEMLINHLNENKPITKEDIEDCYVKAVAPTGVKRVLDYARDIDGQYKYIHRDIEFKGSWRAKHNSTNWFKSNLGACIIKGKLMVIPVIDLDKSKQP